MDDDNWKVKYQPVKMVKMDEYIPCPGSINHYSISLPSDNQVEASEIDETNECYR